MQQQFEEWYDGTMSRTGRKNRVAINSDGNVSITDNYVGYVNIDLDKIPRLIEVLAGAYRHVKAVDVVKGAKVELVTISQQLAEDSANLTRMERNLNQVGTVLQNDFNTGSWILVEFPNGDMVECAPNELEVL